MTRPVANPLSFARKGEAFIRKEEASLFHPPPGIPQYSDAVFYRVKRFYVILPISAFEKGQFSLFSYFGRYSTTQRK